MRANPTIVCLPCTDTSQDAIWAGFFGLFYRKFFWDFVGGTLRDPGGLQYVLVLVSFLFMLLTRSLNHVLDLPQTLQYS